MIQTLRVIFVIFLLSVILSCIIKGRKESINDKVTIKDTCIIENRDSIGRVWLDSTHIRVMFKNWYAKNYLKIMKEENKIKTK